MPRQADMRTLAKMRAMARDNRQDGRPRQTRSAPSRPKEADPAADVLPALLRALAACDPQDRHAVNTYLALDARQRRVVRTLIAELARSARSHRGGG